MPLLRAEAEKLSNNDLVSGIIEEIIDRDETFALMPFTRVDSKALVYNREATIGTAQFLDPNEAITEEASTFTEVVAKLRILARDVDVDKFLQRTMSDVNDQEAAQIATAAKAVRRKWQQTFATGNSGLNAKEFDGLPTLTPLGQTFAAGTNGGAVTLELLDRLKSMIIMGADAYVMREGTWRAVKTLIRALGGVMPDHVMIENFGRVPAFDGVPVLLNDFLAADETQGSNSTTCSIYAVRMNEVDGLHGLYNGPAAGIEYELVGTVQNKDATRHRLKWYTGTALRSTRSIARLRGITNI